MAVQALQIELNALTKELDFSGDSEAFTQLDIDAYCKDDFFKNLQPKQLQTLIAKSKAMQQRLKGVPSFLAPPVPILILLVAIVKFPISRPIAAKNRLVGNARPCPLVWLDLGLVVATAVLGRAWDVVIAHLLPVVEPECDGCWKSRPCRCCTSDLSPVSSVPIPGLVYLVVIAHLLRACTIEARLHAKIVCFFARRLERRV